MYRPRLTRAPVAVYANWCGPCKQLTPVLEKAVKAAGGKVKLVKMNIDEHPQIAGQLGIQSIPAVIAFTLNPLVRELTSLGLGEAKAVVDGAPKAVLEGANKDAAEKAKASLEEAGATVTLK